MKTPVTLQIVLENPPAGVVFALQKGRGTPYEIAQPQRSIGADLLFTCEVEVVFRPDAPLDFRGPYVQGPSTQRFLYIDIGRSAGQVDTVFARRLKIPLTGILITTPATLSLSTVLEARVAGTAKDGTPGCGTVKPFNGWRLVNWLPGLLG